MILIKKYPNRRLYDTDKSQYVNLESLKGLIEQGKTFEVVDSKSGADLTKSILLQIIAEQESNPNRDLLASPVLMRLIRFYAAGQQSEIKTAIEIALHGVLDEAEKSLTPSAYTDHSQPSQTLERAADESDISEDAPVVGSSAYSTFSRPTPSGGSSF